MIKDASRREANDPTMHQSSQDLQALRQLGQLLARMRSEGGDLRSYFQWHARIWTATSLYAPPRLASRRHAKRSAP